MSEVGAGPPSQRPSNAERAELADRPDTARAEIANLTAALHTNRMIGVAIGILTERYKITPEQAFARLVAVSQDGNIKLRDVARQLCYTGHEPGVHRRETIRTETQPRRSGLTVEAVVDPWGHARIGLVGGIDLATVDLVTVAVAEQLAQGRCRLFLDLGGVRFAGAAALSAFIRANQRCRAAGGRLTLVRISASVTRLLRITGLDHALSAADRPPAPHNVAVSMPNGSDR